MAKLTTPGEFAMRALIASIAGFLLTLPSAAAADVVSASADGFELSIAQTIDKPATDVWEMLRSPQKWWDKDHTYSNDSANLYLDAQATGCFCEKLPGKGSVEHAHIVYAQPPRVLRMTGGLGPLQVEPVTGVLTFKLDPEGSGATRVTISYVVGGHVRSGTEAMAVTVDRVLATQLAALKAAAEAAPAPEAK